MCKNGSQNMSRSSRFPNMRICVIIWPKVMKMTKTITAQTRADGPSFVFMDESGKKESDRYFVCGFLEVFNNRNFLVSLQRVSDQIKNLAIRNRIARVDTLKGAADIDQLHLLARSFNEFELKHYHISKENQTLYSDLVKALFKKTNFRFTAIVMDRKDSLYVRDENGDDPLYLKALKRYAVNCAPKSEKEYVFAPDSFNSGFDWNVKSGKLPIGILPLDSKSCLQLQVVDILTGLIAQALRTHAGETLNNKDHVRLPVLNTLESVIGRKITGNLTVDKPHYFSVWILDWSKAIRKPGHGQETQPRPSA